MEHSAEKDAAVWDEALDEVESRIRSGASPSAALWAAREDNPYRVLPLDAHHPRCSGQHETVMGETACVLSPAEKCGVCGATRDEPEKCGYPGGCPIPPEKEEGS